MKLKPDDIVQFNGGECRFEIVGRDQPVCYGWADNDGTFHEEIRHADGRIERFIAATPFGERFEDND
jgi:hypothetical protein